MGVAQGREGGHRVILWKTFHSASGGDTTMTAPSSIDPARFLHDQLESASPDLLRSMLATFINALMSAEADAVCGAPHGMPGQGCRQIAGGQVCGGGTAPGPDSAWPGLCHDGAGAFSGSVPTLLLVLVAAG
jgi:hypothetical protein